ncbi:MAG TPA: O-antigen ligase family protein, partial [Phaeodactylibacter sp.]|nr:O-antigen ligase family protein [Phaeodactylibacter sp.]
MANKIVKAISSQRTNFILYIGFAALLLLGLTLGWVSDWYYLLLLPPAALVGYLAITDFKSAFYLFLLTIPLSMEIELPGGFGTDLPTEPLMVGLMGIYFLYVLSRPKEMRANFIRHPISLIILLHLSWILVTTITSSLFIVSLKFFLAKIWYIVVCYFMAGHLIRSAKDLKKMFWVVFIPLVLTVFIILIRHAGYGFSFRDVNKVMYPFQRNHVSYAATITLFFPFVLLARSWYPRGSLLRQGLNILVLILLVAIYLTFTRAAFVALAMAAGAYYIFRFKMVKYVVILAIIGILGGVWYVVHDNKYLDFAPNYDKTITHYNFDNLIEATYKMEDISTMERVYRWVAGGHMSIEKPLTGFGPGNFYNFYRSYTVTGFTTYVSINKEKSGIHSYYLMTLVEQGFFGLLLFLFLTFYTLIRGERIYHQAKNKNDKRVIMTLLAVIIIIDAFLLINDMIETDKVGTFFFICLALLVNYDIKTSTSTPNRL